MILKLFKTVEQKNVNVFKIKTFKPVQNTINFLLATKFLPAQVYIFSQNYRAVDCSVNISHAVESFPYHHMIMCSKIFQNTTSALFRFQTYLSRKLHQVSFGYTKILLEFLKAQDQIYFIGIGIGIGQEKLDPNHQKMTKRVNEDLYEYH